MSDDTPSQPPQQVAPEQSALERVGDALSRARASRGLSVDDVAAQLKFAPRQVSALEQGRMDAIPGGAFSRGMVRSYCRLLRIEAEPLLALLPVSLPDADRLSERFNQPVPFSDSTRRLNVAYASLAGAALVVAGWVAIEWHAPLESSRLVAIAPGEPATTATELRDPAPAAPDPASSDAETASGVQDGAPARSESVRVEPVGAAGGANPAPAALPSDSSREARPTTATSRTAAGTGTRRLVLRFQREAWVEVRDSGGRTVLSQLNPAGTEKVLDSNLPVSLVIGNAQHVRLLLDGAPIDLQPYIKVEVARLTVQ